MSRDEFEVLEFSFLCLLPQGEKKGAHIAKGDMGQMRGLFEVEFRCQQPLTFPSHFVRRAPSSPR
jgi:hypothetical protein